MTARARAGCEAGQTTALVCAMLFTLVMFVALVANVGQMVNRRVALQLMADAGAWSGATVQAVQLNHYAYWSRFVQNAYVYTSAITFGFRVGECWSSWEAMKVYYYGLGGMTLTGTRFINKAYEEAERHSKFNADDLFPGERDNFDYATAAGPDDGLVSTLLPYGNIPPTPLWQGDDLYTGDHAWSRETLEQWPLELRVRIAEYTPWAVSSAGSGFEMWTCYSLWPPVGTAALIGPAGFKPADAWRSVHVRLEGQRATTDAGLLLRQLLRPERRAANDRGGRRQGGRRRRAPRPVALAPGSACLVAARHGRPVLGRDGGAQFGRHAGPSDHGRQASGLL